MLSFCCALFGSYVSANRAPREEWQHASIASLAEHIRYPVVICGTRTTLGMTEVCSTEKAKQVCAFLPVGSSYRRFQAVKLAGRTGAELD